MNVPFASLASACALLAASSCSRATTVPGSSPTDAPTEVARPPMPPASASGSASAVVSPAVALPPHEERCTTDADCGVTSLDLDGPTVCCFRCCSMHGGRRSWVERVEATCKGAPNKACNEGPCACPSPPYMPKCIDGRCGLVFPPR